MKNWYLVHTKPRKETVAKENLERQDYETYLPLIQETKRRRGQWLEIVEPLFPRYMFVRLEAGRDNFSPIRYTTGVHGIVRFSVEPSVVPDRIVDSLKRIADQQTGIHKAKHKLFEPGNLVFFDKGPFSGLKAVFLAESAQERVIVLLEMMGKENRIIVERNLLRLA